MTAHAGWLGWLDNRGKISRIFGEVLDSAGGPARVRGFASNIANYNSLAGSDGQLMEPNNPCPNELTYVSMLAESLAEVGIAGKGYLIDTSRNGRERIRPNWSAWCNLRGAGLGELPHAAPARGIDAYFWVKAPGESDGASDPANPQHDASCASPASASSAPPAGAWFGEYFLTLLKNSQPPVQPLE